MSHPVAPQLTVVWFACNENGGPGILPLGTFPNATRRTQAWTPQQHSAPMWHAPPEDKPARVTLASTLCRESACPCTSGCQCYPGRFVLWRGMQHCGRDLLCCPCLCTP